MSNLKVISEMNDLQALEKMHQQAQYDLSVAKSLTNGAKTVQEIKDRIKAIKKRKIDLKD